MEAVAAAAAAPAVPEVAAPTVPAATAGHAADNRDAETRPAASAEPHTAPGVFVLHATASAAGNRSQVAALAVIPPGLPLRDRLHVIVTGGEISNDFASTEAVLAAAVVAATSLLQHAGRGKPPVGALDAPVTEDTVMARAVRSLLHSRLPWAGPALAVYFVPVAAPDARQAAEAGQRCGLCVGMPGASLNGDCVPRSPLSAAAPPLPQALQRLRAALPSAAVVALRVANEGRRTATVVQRGMAPRLVPLPGYMLAYVRRPSVREPSPALAPTCLAAAQSAAASAYQHWARHAPASSAVAVAMPELLLSLRDASTVTEEGACPLGEAVGSGSTPCCDYLHRTLPRSSAAVGVAAHSAELLQLLRALAHRWEQRRTSALVAPPMSVDEVKAQLESSLGPAWMLSPQPVAEHDSLAAAPATDTEAAAPTAIDAATEIAIETAINAAAEGSGNAAAAEVTRSASTPQRHATPPLRHAARQHAPSAIGPHMWLWPLACGLIVMLLVAQRWILRWWRRGAVRRRARRGD